MLKNMKTVYIAGFVLMTVFGAFYYQDILFNPSKNTSKSVTNVVVQESSPVTTIDRKFNVHGMYCESCKQKIEAAVVTLAGVTAVSIDQTTNEMIVTYQSSNENIQQTLSIVNGLGYTAGLKSESGKLQVLDFNVTFQ